MYSRSTILSLIIASAVAGLACRDANPAGPSGFQTAGALVRALEQQDATVAQMGTMPPESYCLSMAALRLAVNGENVYVFEYPSVGAAASDAARISPDGGTIGPCAFHWIGPPWFYRKDQLIVLYVGSNPDVIRSLETVMGRPFAGGSFP